MELNSCVHEDARRRFFRDGRLLDLPRRRKSREPVLDLVTVSLLDEGEHLGERELTARLARIVDDAVFMRRLLVDSGRILRTADGSDYWLGTLPPIDSEV
ncbi:MAG: DUF2087 domain-containing protein [Propionibacterium sp.]|nr:DUF2087 domain-containing protein [Propionibacterium sp.]